MPTSAVCRFHCDTNSRRFASSRQIDYLVISFIACITYSVHIRLSWHGVKIPRNICLSNRRIWVWNVRKAHGQNFEKYTIICRWCHKMSCYWRLFINLCPVSIVFSMKVNIKYQNSLWSRVYRQRFKSRSEDYI